MSAGDGKPKEKAIAPPPPPKPINVDDLTRNPEELERILEAQQRQLEASQSPIIPGYLPSGRIHLLGASPSAGKSSLGAQLTYSMRTASHFFGLPTNKKEVFAIFTDRRAESCLEALARMGVEDLPYVSLVDSPDLLRYEQAAIKRREQLYGLSFFEKTLDKLNPTPGSVVLSDVHTNAYLGNIGNQNSLGPHMRGTAAICIERQITLIIVCYGVKIVGDQQALYRRLVDRIIGAPSLRGSADTLMYLATIEETGKSGAQHFQIVSRQAPPKDIMLINRDGIFEEETPEEGLARVRLAETGSAKKPPACMVIYPYVPAQETEYEEILKAFEAGEGKATEKSTASTWMGVLREKGLIESPRRGVWRRKES